MTRKKNRAQNLICRSFLACLPRRTSCTGTTTKQGKIWRQALLRHNIGRARRDGFISSSQNFGRPTTNTND
jgi:hypothetical protein